MRRINRFSEEYKARVASAPARRLEAIKSLLATLRKRGHKVAGGSQTNVMEHWSFAISVDGTELDVKCSAKDGNLRFVIGDYDRFKAKNQFPEPKVGFDFAKIAESVELWVKYKFDRSRHHATEEAKRIAAEKEMKALFSKNRSLKRYAHAVSFQYECFRVNIHCETIEQVERVLLAAFASRIEL